MGERLIKPYEISVWEDKLIQDGATYRFEENKLAVIGSDTMTGLNKVYDPVFNKKTNGERILTFSLRYKYFDPYSGNSDFINPFAALLVNERKVKLHYDNEWYEFIIKDHTESSDGLEWTYSCTDAFVLELSKTGYNLTFDSELNNNQGTAAELAEKVLENTEWRLSEPDNFKQLIAEPIYIAQLVNNVNIINVSNNTDPVPTPNKDIYLFYSYVKNQNGKYVQFIIRDDNKKYTIDDNNVITDTNFRITDDLTYDVEHNCFKKDGTTIITIEGIENRYQANRLAYNQLTTYDPVMGRTVDRFAVVGDDREVYKYTDYEYTTSNIVMNYITNGENFNALEDGTLQGWNPYTDQEYEYNQVKNPSNNNPQEKSWYELVNNVYVLTTDITVQEGKIYYKKEQKPVNKLELITYPQLAVGKELANLNILSQVEGYLKTTFNGHYQIVDGNIVNTVYNSGIDNQASFINSISKGDKFVFRWRAGEGELGQLTPVKTLGLIIARYSQDTPTRFGYYYKHIREEDIIVHFTAHTSSAELPIANNVIEGGALVTEGGVENYVIDNVVQTPSTKYLYKSGNDLYAWDGITGQFIEESQANYLPYYYTIAEANQSVSNTVLTNSDSNIGIFIYTSEIKTTTITNDNNEQTTTINPIYIQDIQLTRFVKDEAKSTDENPYPVLIGNIPTATSQPVEYYYFQPEKGAAAEDVETYASAEKLEQRFGLGENSVTPKYNENSEKTLSISASQSNCFNILQTIAETFECWVDLQVNHDDNGAISIDENGKPEKYVYLREYVGKDNWAGFKYGINLSSIERTVNSDEIVTKLIVDQSQSDYVDEGFVSIASAPSNISGEAYILNFDYYYNQGLLNREEVEAEKNNFTKELAELNHQIQEKEKLRIQLETALTKLQSNRTVFTELIDTAQNNLTEGLEKFKQLTGYEYEEYKEKYSQLINEQEYSEIFVAEDPEASWNSFKLEYMPLKDKPIHIVCEDLDWDITFIGGKSATYPSVEPENSDENEEENNGDNEDENTDIDIDDNDSETDENVFAILYNGYSTFTITGQVLDESQIIIDYIVDIDQLIDEETILDVLGQLYACSSTINNYSGLLTNTNEEYWALRKQLRGNENYSVKYWKVKDNLNQWHICVDVSDYLLGFKFKLGYGDTVDDTWSTYDVTISKKYFDIEPVNHETIKVQFIVPNGFEVINGTYSFETTAQTLPIKAIQIESGIEDEIENYQNQKDNLTNKFVNKYRRFIQEGTWNSTDYIDSELYYLDALQVSNTSAQPQVTYIINVVEVSELEGLELYKFDAGDKTYIEDTEFFGWSNVNGILTPAREEVIVSEVEWHLEEPENNIITVQNYKTRFEDLFQRISAAVQTVQYNEATYAKISTLLDADGTINSDVLLNSLNNISGQKYNLTTDGSIIINGNEILIRNLTNPTNRVIINNEGISVSADGGNTWKKVIDGFGVNADAVITGSLNTQQVIIGSSDNPSFRWDKAGISAYKAVDNEAYDLKTFVRYDQNGLYGIKNGESLKPYNLEEVKDKAHFAVTWDGFFIKNSYPGGGRVEITSDNDFRVMNIPEGQSAEQEKIKIGALEWGKNGNIPITSPDAPGATNAPTLYGIRINNNAGQTVMKTGDDGNLEITGTIYANAGEIGGMSVNNDRLRMDHIVFEPGTGIYSDWGESNVYPFIISDKDGSATFNNVIVRGSIKTSVFEYEEIQAVGGAFMFRPSTAIKTAVEDNGDLVLTVEKPLILRDGAWYKLSNYNSDDTIDADELTTYGLTHIYQLSKTKVDDEIEIRLIGGAAILQTINIDDIPGGSIIDMGFEPNTYRPMKLIAESSPVALHLYELVNDEYVLTTDTEVVSGKTYYKEWYQEGVNNYGIGINSSDNYINLPPRAISLFETIVDHEQDPKVSYKYRGILGTLPQMRYSGNNPQVNELYHNYLEGTQGIYTDNMYLGDHDQYITFYEDNNGKKQLRIKANQIMFEVADPAPDQDPWQDIADFNPEGTPGPAGQDAIRVAIESNVGNEFIFSQEVATLTCTVYRGAENVTSQVTQFLWTKNQVNGEPDTTWNTAHENYNLPYIEVTPSEINKKAIFGCRVTLPEE